MEINDSDSALRQARLNQTQAIHDYLVARADFESLTGKVDEKYFDYIQRNIDAFVQPDGTIRGYRREEYNVDRLNSPQDVYVDGYNTLYIVDQKSYPDARAMSAENRLQTA